MLDEPRNQSGVSLQTLLIAGASSAVAAFVIPMLWEPGTVFAAATTPVIVALVSEALKRPAATVQSVRTRRPPAAARDDRFDPLAPPPAADLEALPQTTTGRRTVQATRRRGLTRRQWTIALATGGIAFAGAVLFVTASELIAGERVGGKENATTFFGRDGGGGAADDRDDGRDGRREATPEPGASPTATPEDTPEVTATPVPAQQPAATPTPTPAPSATPAPLDAPAASPTPSP